MKAIIKSSFIAVFITLFCLSANAQDAPVSFGIKGGLNMSNFGGDEISKSVDDKNMIVGYQAGITLDYLLASSLYLQTGLEFTTKGAKYESSLSNVSGSIKCNPMYIQLPVHIAFKLPITDAFKVVVGAGPYAAYGVGGKIKSSVSTAGSNLNFPDTDFFGDNRFKKFDYGLGINAGVELGKLALMIGYDLGLANIAYSDIKVGDVTISDSKGKVRTQNAYATVGIKF